MMRRFDFAVTLLLMATPAARAEWHEREAAIMGTRIVVEVWHEDSAAGRAALDAVIAEMHRIDELMSHYKSESQLSQVNRAAAAAAVKVDS
ncbi:MAG: FAD:protein FMN transferase [Steroidobacteraceae bacterium]